ncbi:MAG: hypothetical protein H0U57_10805 [Tatlockia sp.]|nr:hypothetical protein [Tatlockia sp.]
MKDKKDIKGNIAGSQESESESSLVPNRSDESSKSTQSDSVNFNGVDTFFYISKRRVDTEIGNSNIIATRNGKIEQDRRNSCCSVQ